MIVRTSAVACIVLFCLNITWYVCADTEQEELAENIVAPKEEYLNVLENLPLLYTHVVDMLQEKPEVLEKNDARMKRDAQNYDEVKVSVISTDIGYYADILQYVFNVKMDPDKKSSYLNDNEEATKNQDGNGKGEIEHVRKNRVTKEDSKDNKVDVKSEENNVKENNEKSFNAFKNLDRVKRSIEGKPLTREQVEKLYDLVEAVIEKNDMNN